MTRAVAQTPSDLVLSSTTESQEAIEHAVGENWKEPFIPAVEKEAEAKAAKEAAEKVLADAAKAEEEKAGEPEAEHDEEELLTAEEKELLERKAKGDKSVGKLPWSTRVNKLTARLASEREARERLEQRLAALERGGKPSEEISVSETATADLPGKPKRIDFKDEETYVEKLIQWTKANEDYKEQIAEQREHAGRIFKEHAERIDEARDRYEDWDDVAKGAVDMVLPPQVDFAIREMSNSADVFYYIAKNPKVFEKMSAMSSSQMTIEAGRISDRLAGASNTNGGNGNGRPRKTRAAVPEPITPGGRRPTPQGKKLEDMTMDEFYRARMTQRAQRRAH
jgi:hypothetical protein